MRIALKIQTHASRRSHVLTWNFDRPTRTAASRSKDAHPFRIERESLRLSVFRHLLAVFEGHRLFLERLQRVAQRFACETQFLVEK
jgi:hypothetical protein